MELINKNCEHCGDLMINVVPKRMYCDKCRRERRNELKRRTRFKYTTEEYDKNFYTVTKNNKESLTTKGFNRLSSIKVKAYTNYFKMQWIDIIRKYNKYDELMNYVLSEYQKFYKIYNTHNHKKFTTYNPNFTADLLFQIGYDNILNLLNINTKYKKEDYDKNFYNVINSFGYIPLYSDFEKKSKISIESYANFFNFKKNIYDKIVKMYCTNEEYIDYVQRRKNHKTKISKQTGSLSVIHSEQDLADEFHRVFDFCYSKYNLYPSRRLFDKLSKISERIYRKRFNKSWIEICKYYGYVIDKTQNNSEKYVLELIKSILNVAYEPQKTWEWLIGVGGKHMYVDGYFTNYNLVVEFDGSQHRKPIKKFGGIERYNRLRENDNLKNKLLQEHNIKLLRIDSRSNWHDINYLKQRLVEIEIQIPEQLNK